MALSGVRTSWAEFAKSCKDYYKRGRLQVIHNTYQSCELAALQCRFLLSPNFNEFTVYKTKNSSRFNLLLSPFATFAHNNFAPYFETFPWLKIAFRALLNKLLVWIASPFDLLRLTFSEKNDEIGTTGRQWYKQ
jgi:hypothetical protein